MPLTRSLILLALVASSALTQITARPSTVVAGTVVRPAGPDLVIDILDAALMPLPGVAAGIGITVEGTSVKLLGLVISARVTNVGTERWAAQGAVALTLKLGVEGDAVRQGVSVVPPQNSIIGAAVARGAAALGPFNATGPIPGSLAPGESRTLSLLVHNSARNTSVIFERDKYYTLDATLTSNHDVNPSNNRSLRVGRFNADHGRLVTQWEPLSHPRPVTGTGTVQVNAPPRP